MHIFEQCFIYCVYIFSMAVTFQNENEKHTKE